MDQRASAANRVVLLNNSDIEALFCQTSSSGYASSTGSYIPLGHVQMDLDIRTDYNNFGHHEIDISSLHAKVVKLMTTTPTSEDHGKCII